jgi:uncharacterized membrane protein
MDTIRLARGLALFSIALGVAQLAAPRALARFIGARQHPTLMRALGARELANGAGLLVRPHKPGWISARVAGDLVDLALLGAALARQRSRRARERLGLATGAVLGVAALDLFCALRLGARARTRSLTQTVTINRPADELYEFWKKQQKMPPLSAHAAPAQVVEDDDNKCLAWRSIAGADIPSLGRVCFLPAHAGRGTVVRLEMLYRLPAGAIEVRDVLRPFKQWMESGEVASTAGQPAGRRQGRSMVEKVAAAGKAQLSP